MDTSTHVRSYIAKKNPGGTGEGFGEGVGAGVGVGVCISEGDSHRFPSPHPAIVFTQADRHAHLFRTHFALSTHCPLTHKDYLK